MDVHFTRGNDARSDRVCIRDLVCFYDAEECNGLLQSIFSQFATNVPDVEAEMSAR